MDYYTAAAFSSTTSTPLSVSANAIEAQIVKTGWNDLIKNAKLTKEEFSSIAISITHNSTTTTQ